MNSQMVCPAFLFAHNDIHNRYGDDEACSVLVGYLSGTCGVLVRFPAFGDYLQSKGETCDEPTAGLGDEAIVVVAGVEKVVGFQIDFPSWLLPGEAGVEQGIGLVVADSAIEVGVGTHTILPTEVQTE